MGDVEHFEIHGVKPSSTGKRSSFVFPPTLNNNLKKLVSPYKDYFRFYESHAGRVEATNGAYVEVLGSIKAPQRSTSLVEILTVTFNNPKEFFGKELLVLIGWKFENVVLMEVERGFTKTALKEILDGFA